jgi:hypothetical protein
MKPDKGIPYRAQGSLGLSTLALRPSRRAPEAAQFVLVFE